MFLNLKDLRRIRGAAALWGHPPRAYRQSPPRFSAVCGFARKVRCFAYLWPKFPKLNALRGTSPPHPLVSLATPREQGDGAKSARLTTCSAAECVLRQGGKGYPKRFVKAKNRLYKSFWTSSPCLGTSY